MALASSVIDASLDPQPAAATVTMAQAVRDILVEVTVGFSPIKVRASDVQFFAVGDVIRLDHPVEVPLVADPQGRPLLLVQHGTTGRRVAVQVVEVLDVAELVNLAAEDPKYGRRLIFNHVAASIRFIKALETKIKTKAKAAEQHASRLPWADDIPF